MGGGGLGALGGFGGLCRALRGFGGLWGALRGILLTNSRIYIVKLKIGPRSLSLVTQVTEAEVVTSGPSLSQAKAAALKVHKGRPPRDLWAEGCLDDDDHEDPTKPPKGVH